MLGFGWMAVFWWLRIGIRVVWGRGVFLSPFFCASNAELNAFGVFKEKQNESSYVASDQRC